MKFRYKVLLVNIIILSLTLSVSGYFIMSRQNRLIMDYQIKNAVVENNLVESAIEYSLLDIINDPSGDVQAQIPGISERIAAGMLSNTSSLFVTYNSSIIYSSHNQDEMPSNDILSSSTGTRKNYIITEEDNKTYIYVISTVYINKSTINIITKRDNSDTKQLLNKNIYLFRSLIVIILLASGLIVYFLTKLLTRPLEKLNALTDEFAEGNFATRSAVHSKDEVGLLSDKFNHMADSVEDHIEELGDMIHRRDQFVADFTHEIKTPMTTIIGYADTIRSVDLPREDQVKAANYIFSEGKRLEQMSSHLFDLIYLKEGKITKQPVNTQALGETVVETVLPAIEKAGITLEADFESGSIMCDSALLKTAFINLLDNARKATTASEAEGKSEDAKTIHFTGRIIHAEGKESEGRKYEYIVEDHGIGIAQKDIDRICDEFYMVDKSRSRSEGGAGLGMSLVAAILKEHNASLEIESELGVGTRMIVTFSELADEEDYFEQGEEDL